MLLETMTRGDDLKRMRLFHPCGNVQGLVSLVTSARFYAKMTAWESNAEYKYCQCGLDGDTPVILSRDPDEMRNSPRKIAKRNKNERCSSSCGWTGVESKAPRKNLVAPVCLLQIYYNSSEMIQKRIVQSDNRNSKRQLKPSAACLAAIAMMYLIFRGTEDKNNSGEEKCSSFFIECTF